MHRSLRLFAYVLLLCYTAAGATIATLRFDELPESTPANGRTVSGVTFSFEDAGVPSNELVYHFSTGVAFVNLTDPVLSGPASGRLFLDFATPTPILEFGIALDVLNPLTSGVTVWLFDPLRNPLSEIPWDTAPLLSFSEGLFAYSGAPIGRAVIEFSPSASSFALDNLTYAVPEPGAGGLLLGGLLGLLAIGKRQR